MRASSETPVTVLGAGWSGLAAAMRLAEAGVPVRVFEAATRPGGRARRVSYRDADLDNGQHVLLGAYRDTLELLDKLGTRHGLRGDSRLCLYYRSSGETARLRSGPWPAPWHLAAALLGTSLLGLSERLAALKLARRLHRADYTVPADRPLAPFLREHGQPPRLIARLWSPLCLAALNTPVHLASTRLFLRVLAESFAGPARHSEVLVPVADLSSLFPEPAARFVQAHGGELRCGERVTALSLDRDPLRVRTDKGDYAAAAVICALPPQSAAELLRHEARLHALISRLERLESSPITTVYLDYPTAARLERDFYALPDSRGQWLFDRGRLLGEHGRLAVVLSADTEHLDWPQERLAESLAHELHALFPHQIPARPLEVRVIREKRATFLATPAAETLRPGVDTPVPGLRLAGDYVRNGLPATLEGAVRNGILAAEGVLATLT